MVYVFLTSLHPKKLDTKFWYYRELEYLHTLRLAESLDTCLIIDNTISNHEDALMPEIKQIFYCNDFPVKSTNVIMDKSLYSENNDIGLYYMLKRLVEVMNDNVSYAIINGRIDLSEKFLESHSIRSSECSLFLKSTFHDSVFSDYFVLDKECLIMLIEFWNHNNPETSSFQIILNSFVKARNLTYQEDNLHVFKQIHIDEQNYCLIEMVMY